ncbi:MAG: LiaF domain-containing protein [Pseudomonadales bacterium]
MAVTTADRPLDTVREETVDQLIMNYGHGHLSLEAFQRRLDLAFEAEEHDALVRLVGDLELQVDAEYVEQKKGEVRGREPAADGDVEYVVDVFGGSNRTGHWRVPAEVRVFTMFGGSDIDFSEAVFTSRTTRIKLLCLFGGVDIYVPEGVNTTVKAFAIFGGIDNRTPSCPDPDAPRLVVEGLVMFGGADVKIRKSLKERAQALAERLRAWFEGERR